LDSILIKSRFFEYVQDSLDQAINGNNSTIFTYGQTGSGKTYTMFGLDWTKKEKYEGFSISTIKNSNNQKEDVFYYNDIMINPFSEENEIIPKTINHVITEIENRNIDTNIYSIYISYIQIYNERIYDLLHETLEIERAHHIREDKYLGIIIDNINEIKVENIYECINLLRKGERNRVKRQTLKNDLSSRSHSIFQIIIIKEDMNLKGMFKKIKNKFM